MLEKGKVLAIWCFDQSESMKDDQKEIRDRIERVFLVTDGEPLETMLLREHEGAHILRADPAQLRPFLALEPAQRIEDHMYLIDPIGNYMMRWPAEPNPSRIKRDLSRLLKASRIG